jgi:VWFA-related protein
MRKWATLILLWGIASPAIASKTMSVKQMEDLLVNLHGKPDDKVVGELENVQLTERVSLARLTRWEAEFPGKRAHEQLVKLADLSAFLEPLGTEVIADPPPDLDTQKRMLWMAAQYVKTTMSRLPDLFATRLTTHFEGKLSPGLGLSAASVTGTGNRTVDAAAVNMATTLTADSEGLYSKDQYSRTVTYRNGKEVFDTGTGKQKNEADTGFGLTTSGEFGPILATVMDAMYGKFRWLRWERGASGPAAEFFYAVPKDLSHYRVGITIGDKVEERFTAYHGEIEVDPATGAILRLSVVPEMAANDGMKAAIEVEYAPVRIGDLSYICPVRGVAFSKYLLPTIGATPAAATPVEIMLNDVTFTRYHLLHSEARIVADGSESPVASTGSEELAQASTASASPAPETALAPAAAASASSPTPATEAPAMPAPTPAVTPTVTQAGQVAVAPSLAPTPAIQTAATPGTIPAPAPAAAPIEAAATPEAPMAAPTNPTTNAPSPALPTGMILHAKSDLVLVDVVVTEHDRPVQGLDRSRFHVFQDGREKAIASFEEFQPTSAASNTAIVSLPALPPNTYTNLPTYPPASAVDVLLLDGLNTEAPDQLYVRREMIRYLKTLPPGRPIAVFTLGSKLRLVQGFTANTGNVLAGLADKGTAAPASLRPSAEQQSEEQAEMDRMADAHLEEWVTGSVQDFMSEADTAQTGMRVELTLEAFRQLARYLSGISVRKNLVWFSGSFPLQFFAKVSDPIAGMRLNADGNYEKQIRATADLLAAARVAVYPVDARGVLGQSIFNAANQTQNYARDFAGASSITNNNRLSQDTSMGMLQTGAEHTSMDVLAQETGGRAVHDSNGLKEAFADALSDGSNYYALSYVPPQEKAPSNGVEFHQVEVKVDGGKYQLAYRRDYYTEDASKAANNSGGMPTPMTEAAKLGAPPSTQILFQTRVLPASDPQFQGAALNSGPAGDRSAGLKGGAHRYVVDLSVNPAGLTFTQGGDGSSRAQLDCALEAYDAEGKPVNTLGRALAFNYSLQQYQHLQATGGTVPVRLALDLPAGGVALRVVVYDPASARTGSVEIPVQVAAR